MSATLTRMVRPAKPLDGFSSPKASRAHCCATTNSAFRRDGG